MICQFCNLANGQALANVIYQGYATEAAKAVLYYAFTELDLPEIISF